MKFFTTLLAAVAAVLISTIAYDAVASKTTYLPVLNPAEMLGVFFLIAAIRHVWRLHFLINTGASTDEQDHPTD